MGFGHGAGLRWLADASQEPSDEALIDALRSIRSLTPAVLREPLLASERVLEMAPDGVVRWLSRREAQPFLDAARACLVDQTSYSRQLVGFQVLVPGVPGRRTLRHTFFGEENRVDGTEQLITKLGPRGRIRLLGPQGDLGLLDELKNRLSIARSNGFPFVLDTGRRTMSTGGWSGWT